MYDRLVAFYEHFERSFYDFYATSMRGSLFAGFLTLSSFLISVTAFIVINMKKELYDTDYYRELFGKVANEGDKVYKNLGRLNTLLIVTIILSLSTSVSQLTIGLIPSSFAALICVSLALLTIVALSIVVCALRANLQQIFVCWEKEAEKKRMAKAPAIDLASKQPRP